MNNIVINLINFYKDTSEPYRLHFPDLRNPFLEEYVIPIEDGLGVFIMVITAYINIRYLWATHIRHIRTEFVLILLTYMFLVLFLVVIILLSQGILKGYPASGEFNQIHFNNTYEDGKEEGHYSVGFQVIIGLTITLGLLLM